MDRHAGEPAVVIRREPLAADRIGQKEAWRALSRLPRRADPPFDRPDDDDDGREERRKTDGHELPPVREAQSQPRRQYAKIAMYSWTMPRTWSNDAPRP